jgi:hypothetical protein
MIALIASTGTRALVKRNRKILLFDQAGRGWSTVRTTNRVVVPTASPSRSQFVCCSHGGMKRGEIAHHALVLVLFVSVDSLRVLTKVVETRKLFATVAGKGAFTGMFPIRRGIRSQGGKWLEEGTYLM